MKYDDIKIGQYYSWKEVIFKVIRVREASSKPSGQGFEICIVKGSNITYPLKYVPTYFMRGSAVQYECKHVPELRGRLYDEQI